LKCKIKDYEVSLVKRRLKILVKKDERVWEYSTKIFKRDGMKIFPKELYTLICKELRYANVYDKWLDRYYIWDENDEEH
jgi:hypothetical protein